MNTNTLEQIRASIQSYKSQIEILEQFAEKFGPLIPNGVASISLDYFTGTAPMCSISTGFSADDRVKALALAGEVFGPQGWTKALNQDRTHYHWNRTINGVAVTIYQAEVIPSESENQPVPPSAFPLLLKEVA